MQVVPKILIMLGSLMIGAAILRAVREVKDTPSQMWGVAVPNFGILLLCLGFLLLIIPY